MQTQSIATVDPETGEITAKTTIPFLRTIYNYDRDQASLETGTACLEETLTQQQFKDECDINVILEKFNVTGEVPQNVRQPLSADFIETFDYQSAQNAILEAQAAFMEMPAKVRAEFDNDPGKFIAFFEKEENIERAISLGLAERKETVPIVTPPQGTQNPTQPQNTKTEP